MNETNSTKTMTLDELLFVSIPSPARAEVIEASVTIERVITTMLAMFLNIDEENSKSLGKTGLSFNDKLNLLADINMIDKDEKAKLIKFSEIRNIFAHNSAIFMFYQCFEQNDLKAFLTKRYGEQNSDKLLKENDYKVLFTRLFEDVKAICKSLFHKMMKKSTDIGRQQGINDFFYSLQHVLAKMSEADPAFGIVIDDAYEKAKHRLKNT